MDTNRKVFRNPGPTLGAELSGILGGNFDYCSGSFFRFPAQYTEELKPSHISHRPIEAMVVAIPRVHLLNTDSVVFSKELISYLKMEVTPLINGLLVSFGYEDSSFPPSVRAFDPAGEPLLSHSQDILSFLKEAGVFNLLTLVGSEERFTTDIYAYYLASFRQGAVKDILTGESGIPFACRASADGYCFNIPLNWARETELKSAYIPDSEVFTIKLPARLFQSEAVISVSAFEARKAGLFTILNTAKKASIGFVQTLKNTLKHLRAHLTVFRKGRLKLRELLNLAIAGDRALVRPVDGYTLLKSRVVEMPTKSEPVLGSLKGLRVSLKTILKRFLHLPCTTLNIAYSREGGKPYRASLSVSPSLKCGVLDSGIL